MSSAEVYEQLEGAILTGQFRPRERLVEMDLVKRFGTSRGRIRDAIKRLADKGLVKISPHKGAVVMDLLPEEVEDIYFVRTHLELLATRLAMERISKEEIATLKRIQREFVKFAKKKDLRNLIETNDQFHNTIFKASRNPYLYRIIDDLRILSHMVRYNAWSNSERIRKSVSEHEEFITALESRDEDKLEKLSYHHINFSKEAYLAQLEIFSPVKSHRI